MNAPAAPRASILIPTYGRPEMAARAVRSALDEAAREGAEVLVLDDASPEDSGRILRSRFGRAKGLRIVRNPRNLGLVANWNKGLRLAKGAHVVLLGDDDMLLPGFLSATLAAKRATPGAGFVFTAFVLQDGQGRWRYPQYPLGRADAWLDPDLLWSWVAHELNPITLCAVLFDTAKLRACGAFDPQAWYAADADAYLRLAAKHGARYLARPLAGNGYHGANLQSQMGRQRMLGVLGHIARRAPLPPGLKGLNRAKLALYLRGRDALNSAWLSARRGDLASLAQDLAACARVKAELPTGALGLKGDLGPYLAEAWSRPLAERAIRGLGWLRRRLELGAPSPQLCRARLLGLGQAGAR